MVYETRSTVKLENVNLVTNLSNPKDTVAVLKSINDLFIRWQKIGLLQMTPGAKTKILKGF